MGLGTTMHIVLLKLCVFKKFGKHEIIFSFD